MGERQPFRWWAESTLLIPEDFPGRFSTSAAAASVVTKIPTIRVIGDNRHGLTVTQQSLSSP